MGRFIVIYSSNNLGKSKQIELLEAVWQSMDRPYTKLKFPIYESETGELINRALRGVGEEKLVISEAELQVLYAENRRQFEPELLRLLEEGDVIAEDYVGTGLAWGLTRGVPREYLDEINAGLLEPDITILLDGDRFTSGIERQHRNESAGQEVWETNRRIHQELGSELGWEVVNANQSPEKIHERIMEIIEANC